MRRAIQQGRRLGIEPGFLPRFADAVTRSWAASTPSWSSSARPCSVGAGEEEAFGRTLEQGTQAARRLIERAKEDGAEGIGADDAFQLHDTFGFPFDLTRELAAEQGLGVDERASRR
jgi:alanyl-tRNA synthetase